MRFFIPVSTAVLILLIGVSGCTGDILTKAGVGDFGGPPAPTVTADNGKPDAEYSDCTKICSQYTGPDAADCTRTCCTSRCSGNTTGSAGTCPEQCTNGALPPSPTGTVTQVTGTPAPKATTADYGCSGSTGCTAYRQCMSSSTEKNGVDCETRCCSSRCFDLPVDEKKACADACLKK